MEDELYLSPSETDHVYFFVRIMLIKLEFFLNFIENSR